MKIAFRQIEAALTSLHCVPLNRRSEFNARIRNLFRAGLPLPNMKVGRVSNFDPGSMLKIVFAFELLNLGVAPQKAVKSIARSWPSIREALSREPHRPLTGALCDFFADEIVFQPTDSLPASGRGAIIIDTKRVIERFLECLPVAGIDAVDFTTAMEKTV